MTHRIGVMGGMFDPVHLGHTAAAMAALEQLRLDELRLVPCATPNHREGAVVSSPHRLNMLQLATGIDERLLIDSRELEREGISYTVDTLRSLHDDFPDCILVLVLGQDAFQSLPGWHKWREIFKLAHVCVVNRPLNSVVATDTEAELNRELLARQTTDAEALFKRSSGSIYMLDKLPLDIASSAVRHNLQAGKVPDAMLSDSVADYIRQHHLYD